MDSMTEAVAGEGFLLGCISCKRREEVPGSAIVDWHYRAPGTEEFVHVSTVILWIRKPVVRLPHIWLFTDFYSSNISVPLRFFSMNIIIPPFFMKTLRED